jgi:hypothetical protein
MARVDFEDESRNRYSVWHHRYDVETNHFRWFLVDCFDKEREMKSLLNDLWDDLEIRLLNGETQQKEQFVGRIRKSSKSRFFSSLK